MEGFATHDRGTCYVSSPPEDTGRIRATEAQKAVKPSPYAAASSLRAQCPHLAEVADVAGDDLARDLARAVGVADAYRVGKRAVLGEELRDVVPDLDGELEVGF